MNVNYEYYRIFYYVAKYGSLTRAANVLHSNQPNITRSMNKLEQEVGCRLFIRNNRGITLTPEGERLFAHVRIAQKQLQAAEEEMEGSSQLQHGSISLGVSETALNVYLLDKLKQFHQHYPKIQIRIASHSTPQALASLRSGTVDLAVVTTPAEIEEPMRARRLATFQDILVGGTAFAGLANQRLSLRELRQQPFIMLARDTMTYTFFNRLFLKHEVVMHSDLEVAATDQILPLVQNNLGLAFLPAGFARPALEKGEIVQIPLKEPIPERLICLVQDGRKPLSIAARVFTDLLLQSETEEKKEKVPETG